MTQGRARGFTVTEMLAVLTIATALALLAGTSVRRSRVEGDVEALAQAVHGAVAQARGRAVATRQPYLVDLRPGSVRYCQVDPATISPGPPAATTQARCPDEGAPAEGIERSAPVSAGTDAELALFAAGAEVRQGAGAVCGTPVQTPIGTGAAIYVGPAGTADAAFARVMADGLPLGGATVYVRRARIDERDKRRRVVVYGPSAQPRIITGY
jgi:prepilin-type N-terminal cleavage/methylation domain-containing protein